MIRKFYDMFVSSNIGAYKDVDGDWHEYHMKYSFSEQNALHLLKEKGLEEALRLYPEHEKLINNKYDKKIKL